MTWNIQGNSEDEAVDVTEVHMAAVMEEIRKTGLNIKTEELVTVILKENLHIIEVGVKKIGSEGEADSGMEMSPRIMTEITGIDTLKAQIILIGVDDGTVIEAKDTVTGGEGENGTLTNNTMTRVTSNKNNTQTPITIAHPLWVINIDTRSHMNSIHTPNNNNISLKDSWHHHARLQTYANYAKIKVIMIINANLPVILWPAHKKLSIKAVHTTTRTQVRVSGQMGTLTTMTPMGNLFSNGGSRCH